MEASLFRFWLPVFFTIPIIYLEIVRGTIILVPTRPGEVKAFTGDTARLVFNYTATDRDRDFDSLSPTWNAYPNGIKTELMYDDYYANPPWSWTISNSTCPDRYKSRISREDVATLVIRNVTKEDTGNYSCIIPLKAGGTPPKSYIILYVSDIPTSPPITLAPNMTNSTQAANETASTPAPSTGLGGGAIAGIVVWCLVVSAIVIGFI